MKRIASVLCLLIITGSAYAQKNKKAKKVEEAPAATANTSDAKAFLTNIEDAGYSKTETGLEYKMVIDAPGGTKPNIGDHISVNIITKVGDSVLFDSRSVNNNQPVDFQVQQPSFKGDLIEGIMLMTAGDSAIFRMSIDSLVKAGTPAQPWMKQGTGQKLVYNVAMVSVKSQAEKMKEEEANASKQIGLDENTIKEHLATNKITATRTASGLYYKIDKPGSGENVKAGQKVTVNYTGKFLDGEPFDSNVDPKFSHVEPFSFMVGQGQVIKGWDEGFMLLKKGSKATLYIPSTLAYGSRAQGPIKANSILIFDVEVIDIQ